MDKKVLIAVLAIAVVVFVVVMTMPKGGLAPGPAPGPSPGSEPGPGPSPGPTPEPEPVAQLDDSQITGASVDELTSANNGFAMDFYKEIIKTNDGNVFFSPWSLESALSMTYEGAKGQTATEMQSVLKIPAELTARGPAFAKLFNEINAPGKKYNLSTANALWVEQTYNLLDSFTGTVGKYYGGGVKNVDFKNDVEGSRQTINTWVAAQTMDKIRDLIPSGVIDDMTKLVLTNAVYFKGTWKTQFDKAKTYEAEFTKSPSETVRAQMMSMGDKSFKYTEDDELQLLEMPYTGDELSMVVLLPKGDLSALEASLSSERLEILRGDASEQELPVYLPKFKFETKYMLGDMLAAMGMPTAFTGLADFSGMSGARDLFISEVIHQAYVDINEEGTEAAAATAVVMKTTAIMDPLVFRADHPFLFLIMKGDTILFMGRVMDPTAAN